MATEIWVNIGSGNGLLPDGTRKKIPEPMLTSHLWCSVVFTWEQLHNQSTILYNEFSKIIFLISPPHDHLYIQTHFGESMLTISHQDPWLMFGVHKFLTYLDFILLTHCPLGNFNEILGTSFSSYIQWLMAQLSLMNLPLDECHSTLLMLNKHWFR